MKLKSPVKGDEADGGRMIGREAKRRLDENLSNSLNPAEYCEHFRRSCSIQRAGVSPMIQLLELCGRSHREIASEVLSALRKKMISLIATADATKLQHLHNLTFAYIGVPELREVVLAVLERVRYIDPDDLKALAPPLDGSIRSPLKHEPYVHLPPSVKQRIWKIVPDLFNEEIDSILGDVKEPEKTFTMEELVEIKSEEARKAERENNRILQKLLKITQDSSKRVDPDSLFRIASIILELCVDEKKTGKRARLIPYANLYLDLLLEVDGLVHFPRSGQYSDIHVAMKTAKTLNNAYTASKLSAVLQYELKNISRICMKGSDAFLHIIILLCSCTARDGISRLVVSRLAELATKKGGKLTEQEDEILLQLTILAWSALKVERILETKKACHMDEAERKVIFGSFFPNLGQTIYEDMIWNTQLSGNTDRNPPVPGLFDCIRRGSFQRRILAAYSLEIYKAQDVIAVSRFRRHFDRMASSADQLLEDREKAIAENLVYAIELE